MKELTFWRLGQISSSLTFFSSLTPKLLHQFLPAVMLKKPLLLVQVTFLKCRAAVIGVRVSHRISDASTLTTFVRKWADTAKGCAGTETPQLELTLASLFPAIPVKVLPLKIQQCKCRTSRYVFGANNIASLRAKAASEGLEKPTRVEAVSGLIWKCATASSTKQSAVVHTVNLRARIKKPLSESSTFGNFITFFSAEPEEGRADLASLAGSLRKGLQRFVETDLQKLEPGGEASTATLCKLGAEYANLRGREDIECFAFTSWCRFGYYGCDFGFGKPVWVSNVDWDDIKNVVVLMDARDGQGVEAWVTLPQQDMFLFETNRDLLQFASLNPCAL